MENELDNDINHVIDEMNNQSESDEPNEELEASSDEPIEKPDIEPDIEPDTEDLTAPIHWTAEDREHFNNLDDSSKEFLLRRHKEMEGDYTRKSSENANYVKNYQSIAEVLEPIREDYTSLGMDEVSAIRYLTTMYQQLATNPAETLRMLAEQTGVDLFESTDTYDFDDDQDLSYSDPRIDQLIKEREQEKRAAQQTQQQQLLQQFTDFGNAKDESGNSKHPFYAQVSQKMMNLYRTGAVGSVDEAYRMAVAADPDLSAKQLQLIKENEIKEQKKKAQRAKKAATGVKGSSANNVDKNEPVGRRDFIEELVNQQFK